MRPTRQTSALGFSVRLRNHFCHATHITIAATVGPQTKLEIETPVGFLYLAGRILIGLGYGLQVVSTVLPLGFGVSFYRLSQLASIASAGFKAKQLLMLISKVLDRHFYYASSCRP